jgi:hypothetical protein
MALRLTSLASLALLLSTSGALTAAAAAAAAALPAPTRMMVEHLPQPAKPGELLVVSSPRPRFAFLPHAEDTHPGAGVEMSGFRIVVTSDSAPAGGAAAAGWDSGIVNASAAVGVVCGRDLMPGHYTWTAQWWTAAAASPMSSASFTIGPSNATWAETSWVGEGHTEFRLQFAAGAATTLFIAAPGGSVVLANGKPVTDECGLAAWIDFSTNVPYTGVNLAPFVDEARAEQTVVVKIGSGFYSGSRWRPNTAGGEGHSGGGAVLHTAARLLVLDEHWAPAHGVRVSGRVGAAVSVDPFVGGIFDTTLADDAGWAPTKPVPDPKAARLDGPLRAFALPPAETAPDAAAALRSKVVSVTPLPPAPAPVRCATSCDPTTSRSANKTLCPPTLPPERGGCDPITAPQKRWHYGFSRNIIGMAAISRSSFKLNCESSSSGGGGGGGGCNGSITVQYCEVFNSSTYTKYRTPGIPFPQYEHLCGPLANLAVVADTFLLGPFSSSSSGSLVLRPSFTWCGK